MEKDHEYYAIIDQQQTCKEFFFHSMEKKECIAVEPLKNTTHLRIYFLLLLFFCADITEPI